MNMPLSIKIFIIYFILVLSGGYLVTRTLIDQIKPTIRQSTEETLVDTANLLAEMFVVPLKNGSFVDPDWVALFERYGNRRLEAKIWGNSKQIANHRIYVTNHKGIVLLDSKGMTVGQDYSQWRDVFLTLRGEYGARSTKDDPNDEQSTVMYVAAPILDQQEIIGVVTVAKPNRTILPYIRTAQLRILHLMGASLVIALMLGAYLSWWFGKNMTRLQNYARKASQGKKLILIPVLFPQTK
jgi:two-component system sensor histidine kinase CreC